ncbi:PepSY-associated TM helix domain-containing protein [Candidatus Uabimicrobium sp. HlEnr_7]|uniref:PepSY-associated TM helix domain-containing protein n=1 Tax=Candidatus Uabimicrobium helgolandensis TaxID=3095367 RepID=UPI003555DB78
MSEANINENPSVEKKPIGKTKRRKSNYLFLPYKFSRGNFLKWLRRTHAWLGLWGAFLGIMFGVTGILLNHRGTWKIPAAQTEKTKMQLEIPEKARASSEIFAQWLKKDLKVPSNWKESIRIFEAKEITWGGRSIIQPKRWRVSFSAPHMAYSADYWLGDSFASVSRFDRNLFAILNRLHTASGASIAWILLADSIAGSFILLSLTGILLWTRLHGKRLLAASLALGSLLSAIVIVLRAM